LQKFHFFGWSSPPNDPPRFPSYCRLSGDFFPPERNPDAVPAPPTLAVAYGLHLCFANRFLPPKSSFPLDPWRRLSQVYDLICSSGLRFLQRTAPVVNDLPFTVTSYSFLGSLSKLFTYCIPIFPSCFPRAVVLVWFKAGPVDPLLAFFSRPRTRSFRITLPDWATPLIQSL